MKAAPDFSLRTSGDLIADRRFDYAQAVLEAEDYVAAADLYAQVLERVPDWPPAHLERGKALAAIGDIANARAAFEKVLKLDPADRLGAALLLARTDDAPPQAGAMSEAFVAALFDAYAPRFDAHLAHDLHYRAPLLIRSAIEQVAALRGLPLHFEHGLDLGCGTGMMAREIASWCTRLDGVDLSSEMLRAAEATGLYSRLECAGILPFLATQRPESAGLVLAADVFCYIPDLVPVFAAVRRVISRQGLFSFTVQTHPGEGVVIGADLRVHHSADWIRQAAMAGGFEVALAEKASSRLDRGAEVPGALFVLVARI